MPVGNPIAANLFKIAVTASPIAPLFAPTGVGSTTGGTLAAASYYGKVSAQNAAGEGIVGAESVAIVITGATGSIVWSWSAVPGATAYNLYVGTAPGTENTKQVLGNVLTYTQTAALGAGTPLALSTVTFSPVSLMNSYDHSGAENVANFDVFDSDDPILFAGKQRRTLTTSGYLADSTDTGQATLFAAAANKYPVGMRMLWDGTNGVYQPCRVNAYKAGSRAGNNPLTASFDFLPMTGAGTIIGTGPLL